MIEAKTTQIPRTSRVRQKRGAEGDGGMREVVITIGVRFRTGRMGEGRQGNRKSVQGEIKRHQPNQNKPWKKTGKKDDDQKRRRLK